jgi:hypothetical protein
MGNRALQLPPDYKPNFEFPNMIVTLNDDSPSYGQRPDVSQKLIGYNLDQTPVVYNRTTEAVLYIQEEMANIPISCTINCESQFQAKEIAGIIKRWLPINKFIQFLHFISYLEVSLDFISDDLFNPAIHNLVNLYTKLNKLTGEIDYCYSVQYDPFIRLDSLTSSIPDSTQRSFQVTVDLTYMIQMPLHMFSDSKPGTIEKIDILINPTSGFDPINDYPSSKIINYISDDIVSLKKGYIRRTFILSESNPEENITLLDSVDLYEHQVTSTSSGGYSISVTKSVDDILVMTVGSNQTQYKVPISDISISPTVTNVSVSEDQYLEVSKDLAGNIAIELKSISQGISIQFSPGDFPITSDYSYNLVKGGNVTRDYQDYTINYATNSITFYFINSQFSLYEPSLISPLMVQFYLSDSPFPKQVGGIIPKVGLLNVFNITDSTAEITWLSDEKTTTQIEYGITAEYGSSSTLDTVFSNQHYVLIRGLSSETEYHYRINVTTESGSTYTSDDYTFITL